MERVRWVRVFVTAITIAACVTYVHVSETEQHSAGTGVFLSPSPVEHGTVQFGNFTLRTVTIDPQTDTINRIVSIDKFSGGCAAFDLLLNALPANVTNECIDFGSGSGTDSGSGSAGSGSAGCVTFSTTATYSFSTKFTPTATGDQTCTVAITFDDGLGSGSGGTGPQTTFLSLHGIGAPPPLKIVLQAGTPAGTSPCTSCLLDFGQVNVNATAPAKTFKVINIGGSPASLNSVGIPQAPTPFTLTSGNATIPPAKPISPNGFETYDFTCTPTAEGVVTDTVTLVSDDPTAPTTVQLRCEGVQSKLVTDGSLAFITRVNEAVTSSTDLHNDGSAPLTITAIAFDAPGFLFSGVAINDTIAAQGTKTLSVTTTPVAAGTSLGTLTISFTGTDGPETRDILLEGPVSETTFSLSPINPPGTADLGVVCIGSTHLEPFTLTANNAGTFKLQDLQMIFSSDVYSIIPRSPASPPPHPLQPNGGNSVEFDVAFTPTAPGLVPGVFSFSTDIPLATAFAVGLVAIGLPTGQHVTPTGPVDFGLMKTGETSPATAIRFTNCTETPLAITSLKVTGDQDFAISNVPTLDIGKNGTIAVEVEFRPAFGGSKRAEVVIEYSGGTQRVTLIGEGDGPLAELPADPRDSYYRCDAGGASGSALVWLAIVFAARRRRRRV